MGPRVHQGRNPFALEQPRLREIGRLTSDQRTFFNDEDGGVITYPEKGGFDLKKPNDKLMMIFGVGIVVSWVMIASIASYFSIVQEREITDSQLTVIGLLGGPALLIITSVLDLFKSKEGQKITIMPESNELRRKATEALNEHTRMIETMRMKHDLELEKMTKAHHLKMDEYLTTKGEDE